MNKILVSIFLLFFLPTLSHAVSIDYDDTILNDVLCAEFPEGVSAGCEVGSLLGDVRVMDSFQSLINRFAGPSGFDPEGILSTRISVTKVSQGAIVINIMNISDVLNDLAETGFGNELKNAGILEKCDGFKVNPLVFTFFGLEQLTPWISNLDCLYIPLKLPNFAWIDWNCPWQNHGDNDTVPPVPEPATILILGSCLIGLKGVYRKFRS